MITYQEDVLKVDEEVAEPHTSTKVVKNVTRSERQLLSPTYGTGAGPHFLLSK